MSRILFQALDTALDAAATVDPFITGTISGTIDSIKGAASEDEKKARLESDIELLKQEIHDLENRATRSGTKT
jgi:hypothetical protein